MVTLKKFVAVKEPGGSSDPHDHMLYALLYRINFGMMKRNFRRAYLFI